MSSVCLSVCLFVCLPSCLPVPHTAPSSMPESQSSSPSQTQNFGMQFVGDGGGTKQLNSVIKLHGDSDSDGWTARSKSNAGAAEANLKWSGLAHANRRGPNARYDAT